MRWRSFAIGRDYMPQFRVGKPHRRLATERPALAAIGPAFAFPGYKKDNARAVLLRAGEKADHPTMRVRNCRSVKVEPPVDGNSTLQETAFCAPVDRVERLAMRDDGL
jgi:hypothetical protein